MARRARHRAGRRRSRSLFQLGSAESSTASSNGSMTPASEAAHSLHTSRQVSNPQASISGVRLRWNSNCASHCGQMTTRAARTGTALSFVSARSFVSTRSAEFAIMSTIAVWAMSGPWRCLYSRRSETLLAGDPSNFSDRVELRLTVSVGQARQRQWRNGKGQGWRGAATPIGLADSSCAGLRSNSLRRSELVERKQG